MKTLQITTIQFPEMVLPTSAAHQLRGFFGNLFKEKSTLLHNHYEDGKSIYDYPVVQYKVIDKMPILLGINVDDKLGANLLAELFLKIKHLDIKGTKYEILNKNIQSSNQNIGIDDNELHEYEFKTLWMALNQDKHKEYLRLEQNEKKKFLDKALTNNLVSLSKGVGYTLPKTIIAKTKLIEKQTLFKDQEMMAFAGTFVCNMQLPNLIGIGKSVSRGFGTVLREV